MNNNTGMSTVTWMVISHIREIMVSHFKTVDTGNIALKSGLVGTRIIPGSKF